MTVKYKLYLDDLRNPPNNDSDWIVARSSDAGISTIEGMGLPYFMSLDHDLGGDDTTKVFLKKLYELFPDGPVPRYVVHSANPIGRENIISYLESWKKSLTL